MNPNSLKREDIYVVLPGCGGHRCLCCTVLLRQDNSKDALVVIMSGLLDLSLAFSVG